ncbi:MAG TPA: MOSC domain-containing protein [Thermoanaerobaculia bacterium]|nr:MOSC domain-containing protein [Thermoanaerobaculia bacterium]
MSVKAIWIKRAHRGPMDRVERAELVAGRGVRGSANQGGRRQVSIISQEAWDAAIEELGVAVDPSARRANVMVSGVDLENSRGKLLRIGPTVVRILGEVRPCERMDEAEEGLRNALKPHWRGGVFGEIVEGGTIATGDAVAFCAG